MIKRLIGNALGLAFSLYIFGTMAAVPYFNWRYAREHGFVSWILLGEVVATGEGIAWPYFVFRPREPSVTWTDDEKESIRHFFASMEATQAATRLGNAGPPYSTISESTMGEIQRLRRRALQEAVLVPDDVLEKAMPGMSALWREKHQRGLELQIQAVDKGDISAEIAGSALHNEWVEWINASRERIRIPK